ncbi:MAG TPA: hypothetical protein VE008_11250, partial [Burkholderiales bacterium]|nr:hypothetical protein [Burkholderiales bacterium]
MSAWLRKLLIAPEYPGDAELSVQSRLFTFSALVLLAGSCVALANDLLAGDGRFSAVILVSIAAIVVLMVAARRGHLRIASALLPVLLL